MEALLKVPCGTKYLVIYKDRVSLELRSIGFHKSDSIFIKEITGIKINTKLPSLIPSLSIAEIIITGTSSQQLKAGFIKLSKAKEAEVLINSLRSTI